MQYQGLSQTMKAERQTKLSNLHQHRQQAVEANGKTALQQLPRSTQHSQSRTEAVPPGDAVFKFVLLKASQVRCFLTKTCAEDNETLRRRNGGED